MSEWLKQHNFTYSDAKDEWEKALPIIGNFKIDEGDSFHIEQRKIQELIIIVKYFDNQNGESGYGAMLCVKHGKDLDNCKDEIFVKGSNYRATLCQTPKEAIEMAANDLDKMLISCLKQVAKLGSREITINVEEMENI